MGMIQTMIAAAIEELETGMSDQDQEVVEKLFVGLGRVNPIPVNVTMTRHLALAALHFAQGCLRMHQEVLSGRDVHMKARAAFAAVEDGDMDFSTERADQSQSKTVH
jgi:hypothetical protein